MCRPELSDLIIKMLSSNEADRPTAQEITHHPLLVEAGTNFRDIIRTELTTWRANAEMSASLESTVSTDPKPRKRTRYSDSFQSAHSMFATHQSGG